jgi:hypothetical protein
MNFTWIIILSVILIASVVAGTLTLWRRTRFS